MHVIDEIWRRTFDRPSSFLWQGEMLPYFFHPYNATWSNERRVEIPIAFRFLDGIKQSEFIEVGNVLAHYIPARHTVVDLFEKRDGVINQDIETFVSPHRFKALVSISTIEHCGENDHKEKDKAIRVLESLPRFADRVLATWLIGYNPILDEYAVSKKNATMLTIDRKRAIIVWQVG